MIVPHGPTREFVARALRAYRNTQIVSAAWLAVNDSA